MESRTELLKCVELAGSQRLLAEALGVSQQAVNEWVGRGYCPPKRSLQLKDLYKVDPLTVIDPRLAKFVKLLIKR